METALPLLMFVCLLAAIMMGYPVAFTLGGIAMIFGLIGLSMDDMFRFRWDDFSTVPTNVYGKVISKITLLAVPLFIFMGITLEKSGLAKELLESMQILMKRIKGGLAISVVIVGALLAASTGIVGATVVTMGAMALPTMLSWNYNKELACGTISASGTLGQIIPPSIVLVLLGDMMNIDVGDLFVGSMIPGLMLVGLYILYIFIRISLNPDLAPVHLSKESEGIGKASAAIFKAMLPPLLLMIIVLGSILTGMASPTEASACGALGALIITFCKRRLSMNVLKDIMLNSVTMTSMVFTILIGAQFFSVVFRGLGGDEVITSLVSDFNLNPYLILTLIMLLMFFMGFFLDFIEICFIVIPIVAPLLIETLGFNPLWLAILIAINLQTSFLTPPFGFALFYLKGVAPPGIRTSHIYRGIIPFVGLQLFALIILIVFPEIATWLPSVIYPNRHP